jgi:hypothetical protein
MNGSETILKSTKGKRAKTRDQNPPIYEHSKKVKQFRYRPGVAQRFQEVKVPRLHDNGTGWW